MLRSRGRSRRGRLRTAGCPELWSRAFLYASPTDCSRLLGRAVPRLLTTRREMSSVIRDEKAGSGDCDPGEDERHRQVAERRSG